MALPDQRHGQRTPSIGMMRLARKRADQFPDVFACKDLWQFARVAPERMDSGGHPILAADLFEARVAQGFGVLEEVHQRLPRFTFRHQSFQLSSESFNLICNILSIDSVAFGDL